MSDALPLPPRPNLEQYKKLAKDFQKACKSGDENALRDWAARWAENLARLRGVAIANAARQIERNFRETKASGARCKLADAQFFVARQHGFASWPKFVTHLEGLQLANSSVSKFEQAVDAIVSGDAATLERLLRENPELIHERSTREHRSTLLHYVSANGVEDFRQETPKNIIVITRLLLDAGADVNAESDAYAGRSTTLDLTATSWHPENAGVQIPLMQLLLSRGAIIDGPAGSSVNACLHNGRGRAAEFLAGLGARLDLEGAAGAGRLEVVKSFFNADGSLKPVATKEQLSDGFSWACSFGWTSVVDFLLQHGIEVNARLRHHGQTGLHSAAYGGHAEIVKLLLERGAAVTVIDENYGGTPLGWALYSWSTTPKEGGGFHEVVAMLVAAGARLEPQWLDDRPQVARKVKADPRMRASIGLSE